MSRAAATRAIITLGLLIALLALAGCMEPTTYPLDDEDCWVYDDENDLNTYEIDGPFDEPQFEAYERWEWDGVSRTAIYHAGQCTLDEDGYTCEEGVGVYRRVCDIPGDPGYDPGADMNAHHGARPVAIYRGYEVWGIDPATGEGAFAFELTGRMIAEAGVPDDEPLEIAWGINPFTEAEIIVFRLPNGDFQLNTWYVGGKPYIVTWKEGQSTVRALDY